MKAAGLVGAGSDWSCLTAALRQAFVRLAIMDRRSPDNELVRCHAARALPL